MFIVKPNRCPENGCTETHIVERHDFWKTFDTGETVPTYSGKHHGDTFVYHSWMVTEIPDAEPLAECWGVINRNSVVLTTGTNENMAENIRARMYLTKGNGTMFPIGTLRIARMVETPF